MAPPKTDVAAVAGGILENALNAAQFAAQFTPIPALGPALAALGAIVQACNNITSNNLEVGHLRERCRFLIGALNDPKYINSTSAESLVGITTKATARLQEVQRLLTGHANQSRWEAFLKQYQISKDIQACHSRIDDCCKEFGITLSLQLRQWQGEHTIAYNRDREELSEVLKHLGKNELEILRICRENKGDIENILELLQIALRSKKEEKDYSAYNDIQDSLYVVHRRTGQLPPEVDLSGGEAKRIGKFPVAGSAAYDVWEGLWLGREKVAMKTLRGVRVSPDTRKRYLREIAVWRKIWAQDGGRHILPLYGVYFDDSPFAYMVSPWMHNGTVMHYLRNYPQVDRLDLITGIAKGLRFLHSFEPPIAHGDIKGNNILIDDSGNPLLADFGVSKIIEDFSGVPFTQSQGVVDSYRWFAPEMCTPPGVISTYSDVFTFAITIIEIVTMRDPYDHIKYTCIVLTEMPKGERPKRPSDMDDRLWEVCTACWKHTPDERAPISWVVEKLEKKN